jgi:hypothetical protein
LLQSGEDSRLDPGGRPEGNVVRGVAILLPIGDGRGQREVERRLDALLPNLTRSFENGHQELQDCSLG